jgi:hypothetical protein
VRAQAIALTLTLLVTACGESGGTTSGTAITASVEGSVGSSGPTAASATASSSTRSGHPSTESSGTTTDAPQSTTGTSANTTPAHTGSSGSGSSVSRSSTGSSHSTSPTTSTAKPNTCATPPKGTQDGRQLQAVVFPAFGAFMWPKAEATLTACATSGLPVTYAFENKYGCTLTGTHLSMAQPGWCTITASQDGDATYAPASPVTRKFLVDPQLVTLSWRQVPASLKVGQTGDLILLVTSPSGPVTHGYLDGGVGYGSESVCSGLMQQHWPSSDGTAHLSVTATGAGSCTIKVFIRSDQFVHGVTAPELTVTINS